MEVDRTGCCGPCPIGICCDGMFADCCCEEVEAATAAAYDLPPLTLAALMEAEESLVEDVALELKSAKFGADAEGLTPLDPGLTESVANGCC